MKSVVGIEFRMHLAIKHAAEILFTFYPLTQFVVKERFLILQVTKYAAGEMFSTFRAWTLVVEE